LPLVLVSFGTVKQGGIVAAVDIQIMVDAFRNHRDSYYFKIRTGEECAPAIKDNIEITNDFLQQPEILCNLIIFIYEEIPGISGNLEGCEEIWAIPTSGADVFMSRPMMEEYLYLDKGFLLLAPLFTNELLV